MRQRSSVGIVQAPRDAPLIRPKLGLPPDQFDGSPVAIGHPPGGIGRIDGRGQRIEDGTEANLVELAHENGAGITERRRIGAQFGGLQAGVGNSITNLQHGSSLRGGTKSMVQPIDMKRSLRIAQANAAGGREEDSPLGAHGAENSRGAGGSSDSNCKESDRSPPLIQPSTPELATSGD